MVAINNGSISKALGTNVDAPASGPQTTAEASLIALDKLIANNTNKLVTPGFSTYDTVVRPANATPYSANKSMNCNVSVTAMSYALKVVTLTANNAFAVGDRITVAGVNTGFTVTNIDGNWICKTGTNASTVVFDVAVQPTGTTPQTITAGTIAKCLSLDVAAAAGGTIILSRLSVSLPGVAMTGAIRVYPYTTQPTVLVDQATFTLLAANDTNRKDYIDLYPVTEGSGSDCTFASKQMWEVFKLDPTETRLYFRLASEGAGTPTSGGTITIRGAGLQILG
jgi:hypothetical protein